MPQRFLVDVERRHWTGVESVQVVSDAHPRKFLVNPAHEPEDRERIHWQDADGVWHEEWIA